MLICGLQKTTLIDYPGHIACTVFTGGCNFRCPFCHNPELVQPEQVAKQKPMKDLEFFWWLNDKKGELEGVCITGGEPTIHADLPDFCANIKHMGFDVKLDTNGTNPMMLEKLYAKGLVDFVAMDIKNHLEKYGETNGLGMKFNIDPVKRSVEIIKNSKKPYDFRTTVVRGLHTLEDIEKIAEWLKDTEFFSLQNFHDTEKANDPDFMSGRGFTQFELEEMQKVLEAKIKKVRVLN
ncbi:MAG: anaerobic ribonucleoside-triphosphate reductase activating protein [Patescibacteria group bacterium]|nr:anaerobic ribonucleoside-triphosphate reductase activating protein [Patescibacteria group bacterium]